MKAISRNYLIFTIISIVLLGYFYFFENFYIICIYDTYYLISYFFFVLAVLILGTIFYLIKFSKRRKH